MSSTATIAPRSSRSPLRAVPTTDSASSVTLLLSVTASCASRLARSLICRCSTSSSAPRALRRDAWPQPADRCVVVIPDPADVIVVEPDGYDDVGRHSGRTCSTGKTEARGKDAHNQMRNPGERNRSADGGRITAESLLPERISDDGHCGPAGSFVVRRQRAAGSGLKTEHVEERAARVDDGDLRGFADAGEVCGQRDVLRHRFERRGALPPVFEMLLVDLERGIPHQLAPHLAKLDELLRFAIRERLQQHAVDDGENSTRPADGERERDDDGESIRALAAKAADGVAEIEGHGHHEGLDGGESRKVMPCPACRRPD